MSEVAIQVRCGGHDINFGEGAETVRAFGEVVFHVRGDRSGEVDGLRQTAD